MLIKTQAVFDLMQAHMLNLPAKSSRQNDDSYESSDFATTDGGIINPAASTAAVASGMGIIIGGFYIGIDLETDLI